VRPTRGSPPRIGIIHDLHCHGGVATYHLTLSETPSSRVAWSAMAVPILQRFNPALFRRLERPVFSPESYRVGTEGLVTKTDDWPAAVQAVVDRSDVILVWGKLIVPGLEHVDFQGKPVIVQAFGACQWTRDLVKDLVPFSTHGMAISAAAAATFPSHFRDRVRVCWPGIAAEEVRPTATREQVRAEWGLAPGDRAIGYLGRMSPEKNPWLLLDLLAEGDSRTHLIYAGEIWHTEVPAMDPERRRRVHLLPPPARMPDVLVGLDALVLASPSEGFSLLLIEAWANRIPTIATRVGSIPELERREGELVIPLPRSPRGEHLRLAVGLLDSPEVATMVENAHRIVREQLTAGQAVSRFEEIVDWALRGE
jgi:glycosyltransferase involved in cell wall biosynthesis